MENNFNPYTKVIETQEIPPVPEHATYDINQRGTQPGYENSGKKSQGFGKVLVKTVAIALVFGLVSGAVGLSVVHFGGGLLEAYAPNGSKDEPAYKLENTVVGEFEQTSADKTDSTVNVSAMDVSDIVKNAMPSVVAINNISEVTYHSWGGVYTQENESCGTGFIVEQDDKYLYIATNNHVVADAKKLTVQFSDMSVVEAEVKGTVASKDLAVIKVKLKDIEEETLHQIRVATLGDSTKLEVGETAIAIGNALGYGQSVTTGVISAQGRSVTVSDATTGETIVCNNLIQTDAAINPGNSGGALLNIAGQVIGINSVKYSDTDVEGIGYAIPISDAMLIIDKLIDGEKIDESQSGYLGIYGQDCEYGAYVKEVLEGSAAERAGLQAEDIIVQFEGLNIGSMSQLKELLSFYPAGETVEFVVLRSVGEEYKELTIQVTLGDASTILEE